MINSIKKIDELRDLEEIEELQSKVKQVKLVEKLGKQGFHCNIKELFESITKTVTESNQKLLEEAKSTTKAIEELDESNVKVKASEFLNENRTFPSSLLRPLAKL